MFRLFCLVVFFQLLFGKAFSQVVYSTHYGVEEGLMNERLIDVKTTSKNELMILSESGFSVFDGTVFHNYPDSASKTNPNSYAFAKDQNDHIYIGQAVNHKLVLKRFYEGRFDTLALPKAILGADLEKIGITISKYNDSEYLLLIADSLFAYKKIEEKQWSVVVIPNLIKSQHRIALKAEILKDSFYILTRKGLLSCPINDDKKWSVRAVFDLSISIPDFHLNKEKDGLFLLVGNELLFWNGNKVEQLQVFGDPALLVENPLSIIHTNRITLDNYGNPCLILKNGLFYYVKGPFGLYVNLNVGSRWSLAYNGAAFTKTNGLLLSTKRGLLYTEKPELYSLKYAEGPLEVETSTLLKVDDKTIFSGSNLTYSFIRSNSANNYYISSDVNNAMKRSARILDGYVENGVVYIAADEFGHGKIENERRVTWLPNKYGAVLKSFASDGKNRYAISSSGFFKVKGEQIERILPLSHFARKLVYLPEVEIFVICGIDGLYLIKEEQVVWKKLTKSGLLNSFSAVYFQNQIIVGGMGGLFTLSGDSVSTFKVQGNTFNHNVYSMLIDSDSILWLGTNKGLFALKDNKLIQYSARNGLAGDECNRSALIQIGDNIWNGSNLGLNIVNKKLVTFDFPEPKIKVSGLKKNTGGIVDISNDVELQANENHIEILFNALAFNTETIEFEYYLDGYQSTNAKVFGNGRMVVSYEDLPPGDYVFNVRGKYSNSDWGKWEQSGQISIEGVFYKTKWFAGIVMLLSIYVIWLLFSLINQRRVTVKLKKLLDREKQRIQLSEKRFETLFNSASSPIAVITQSGIVRETNIAFQSLFKKIDFSKRDINLNVLDRFYLMEGLELHNILKDYQKEKSLKVYIDSAPNFFTLSVEKLAETEEENGQFQYLLVLFDVTERKNYERELLINTSKAEEANRLKTSFLANMSHEIRTPLNGILGISQIIEDEYGQDEGLREYLELIKESGDRLLNTINSVLDISKIEANKFELFFEEKDVVEVVNAIVKSMQPMALRKSLLLKLDTSEKIIALIDKKALQTIVTNLVGNAVKYTEKGKVLISVVKQENNKTFEIVVKDTGIGISEDFIPNLFGIFEQESTGYGRKFEGTGLGLSITKKMSELMQGKIHVESVKGEGSTFTVTLPIQPQIIDE